MPWCYTGAMPADILEGLNPAQRQAIEHIEGPLLIIAGPGSGKTRVIAHRIAYLVSVVGISPHRIAAVTFTNKAARELRDRLHRLMGPRAADLTASTFHALCAAILRRDGDHIGLDRSFVIYDEEDQLTLLRRAMEEVAIDPKQFPPRAILSTISRAKSQLLTVEQFGDRRAAYFDEIVYRAYQGYQALLQHAHAVDFDDLLLHTYTLLSQNAEVAARYQSRYLHLLIDEFQDTNIVQYAIARLLAAKYRNICVVGDPDQSIYSWRNADIRNILSFQADYPEATSITLAENYRSTQTILDGARQLIATNQQRLDKELFTSRPSGEPITLYEAYNEAEEAQFVAQELQELQEQGHHLADCAIMYRVNAQSRAFEEVFIRYGVPYRLIGGVRFYQRREVKDVIAYLRLLYNPSDEVSLARVINTPPRGIGQRTLDELTRWARDHQTTLSDALHSVAAGQRETSVDAPPLNSRSAHAVAAFAELLDSLRQEAGQMTVVELLDAVVQRSGYRRHLLEGEEQGEERWENILELRAAAQEYADQDPEEGLAAFLETVSLVADIDALPEERTDAVTLITLHQAKGLEFPVVFMVGMEDGLLPHVRSMDDPAQMEEERRLCYVGMTRAQDRLYMTRAFRRTFQGGSNPAAPSRFLQDLPRELTAIPAGAPKATATTWWSRTATGSGGRASQQKEPLKAGQKVRHAKFGEGIVVSCTPSGDDHEVTVAFVGGAGVKRLLLSFAPLERTDQGAVSDP